MAITMAEESREELLSYLNSPDYLAAASTATRMTTKLAVAVQQREFYEAHQLLRTMYFRFINHKDRLKPLIDLLYYGAKFLLANQETISGQDVATLCIESSARLLQIRLDVDTSSLDKDSFRRKLTNSDPSYHRENKTIDFEICNMIAQLAYQLPDAETGRSRFFAEAIKLLSPKILNRELLHTVLARTFMSHLDYVEARYHFLHCANVGTADDIGQLLAQYHQFFGNKNEVDLFLAQFVLQFLCLQAPSDLPPTTSSDNIITSVGNKKSRTTIRETAQLIIRRYRSMHHQLFEDQSPSPKYPLFNFLNFITSILDAAKPETQTFKTLCNLYKTVWDRDPNYLSYLNRIGVLYFGVVDHTQQQQGGFFNNILMSLLDGADDDDEASSQLGSNTMVAYDDLD